MLDEEVRRTLSLLLTACSSLPSTVTVSVCRPISSLLLSPGVYRALRVTWNTVLINKSVVSYMIDYATSNCIRTLKRSIFFFMEITFLSLQMHYMFGMFELNIYYIWILCINILYQWIKDKLDNSVATGTDSGISLNALYSFPLF